MPTTLDITKITNMEDSVAKQISNVYVRWNQERQTWLAEKRELRNFIFATDTSKTSVKFLPWKNSTTLPKLCQIRDNLHANYMAALFPHKDWLDWEAQGQEEASQSKRNVIKSFMYNKLNNSGFETTVSSLVYDFIDYGNAFATVEWVDEHREDPNIPGTSIQGYIGPKVMRINPVDIVFNPTASDFRNTPKIIRSLKSLGELKKVIDKSVTPAEKERAIEAFNKAKELRTSCAGVRPEDMPINERFQVDGFGSYINYLNSGTVEVLTFYGDLYDQDKDIFYEDHIITIIDRQFTISCRPNESWLGKDAIKHSGWRLRQDNLYAMGPLDNLVGMQYRIDHLENLKADVFDLIAYPIQKVRGYVEDYTYQPGERIICGDDGDVDFLRPDTTALNADTQIAQYQNQMEEMAGAPRQAMGIRTPGEKTAYEVQALDNAAGRIFQNKVKYFEETLVEPILNNMLEVSRRNMNGNDIVRIMDDELGVQLFEQITKEDITAAGKIKPAGASHFARKAQIVQNLNGFLNSAVAQDPMVNVHISGYQLAKTFAQQLGIDDLGIVKKNVRLMEQADTQSFAQELQNTIMEDQMTNADGTTNQGINPMALASQGQQE